MTGTRGTPERGGSRRWLLLAGPLVALGVVLGVAAHYSLTGGGHASSSGLFEVPPPTPSSLIDLVSGWGHRCDVIAVAKVASLETGFDPTPTPAFLGDRGHPPHPHTYFHLTPERVLLDDGTIRSGQPLLVGRDGFPDEHDPEEYPFEKLGDRYLYCLQYVPELGVYIANWNEYFRLIIDGDTVMYSGQTLEPVPFAQGTPPAAFVDAVATAVATAYATPTP